MNNAVFGYRSRLAQNGWSSFELLYGVKKMIVPAVYDRDARSSEVESRRTEFLALLGQRLSRIKIHEERAQKRKDGTRYAVGDLVMVEYEDVIRTSKWPAFKTRLYGPCRVVGEKNPRYSLVSSTRRRSRKGIHARRLLRYHCVMSTLRVAMTATISRRS